MPYIGYWQLINAVDIFVVYDNIKYVKGGWFNRNRILKNGVDQYITIPLKKDSDYLNVDQRFISNDYNPNNLLRQIKESYIKAPYFESRHRTVSDIFQYQNANLFEYIYNSILAVNKILNINTQIVISSTIKIDHTLKGKDKVIAICQELGATHYYNPIGGQTLYDKDEFSEHDLTLSFLKANLNPYPQFRNDFVPGLSIIDILMFNSLEQIGEMLHDYTLL